MNSDIFDDLPDHLKDAIRDMMKRIQEIDPDELEKMMKQIFPFLNHNLKGMSIQCYGFLLVYPDKNNGY